MEAMDWVAFSVMGLMVVAVVGLAVAFFLAPELARLRGFGRKLRAQPVVTSALVAVLLVASLPALADELTPTNEWVYHTKVDVMTDKVTHMAVSPTITGEPFRTFHMSLKCDEGRRPQLRVSMLFGYLNVLTSSKRRMYATNRITAVQARASGVEKPVRFWMTVSAVGRGLYASIHNNKRSQRRWANALSDNEWELYRFSYYRHGSVDIKVPLAGAEAAIAKVANGCGFDLKRDRQN